MVLERAAAARSCLWKVYLIQTIIRMEVTASTLRRVRAQMKCGRSRGIVELVVCGVDLVVN